MPAAAAGGWAAGGQGGGLSQEAEEHRAARLRAERELEEARRELTWRRDAAAAALQDVELLGKAAQRAQGALRRGVDRCLDSVRLTLEQFRVHAAPADLGRRLVAATVAVVAGDMGSSSGGGSGFSSSSAPWATTVAAFEGLAQDLRQVLADTAALCPGLLDGVGEARRESEALGAELGELAIKARKAGLHLASAGTDGCGGIGGGIGGGRMTPPPSGTQPQQQQPVRAGAFASTWAGSGRSSPGGGSGGMGPLMSPPSPVGSKLLQLEEAADETAQMLRGMARAHAALGGPPGHIPGLLRAAQAQQSEMALEVAKLKRQREGLQREVEAASEARDRAERELARAKTLGEAEGARLRHELETATATRDRLEALSAEQGAALAEARQALGEARGEAEALRGAHRALLDRLQEADRVVEAAGHREGDALERMRAAEDEARLLAARAEAVDQRHAVLADGAAHLLGLQHRRLEATRALCLWRLALTRRQGQRARLATLLRAAARVHGAERAQAAAEEEIARLQSSLAATEAGKAEAEAAKAQATAAGDALAEACAGVLARWRAKATAARALRAWAADCRGRRQQTRKLGQALLRFALRQRAEKAEALTAQTERRAQDFARALEETLAERAEEHAHFEGEVAEARAAELGGRTELARLQAALAAAEAGRVEAEGELEGLKRELEAEVAALVEGGGSPRDDRDGEGEGESGEPASDGDTTNRMGEALLLLRVRRAEQAKAALKMQLAEARADVQRLSGDVAAMVAGWQQQHQQLRNRNRNRKTRPWAGSKGKEVEAPPLPSRRRACWRGSWRARTRRWRRWRRRCWTRRRRRLRWRSSCSGRWGSSRGWRRRSSRRRRACGSWSRRWRCRSRSWRASAGSRRRGRTGCSR